jgi:putative ABC transport system permease protein
MEGGFNDVVLTLAAGARPEAVTDRVTALLHDYGGLDAQDRYWQTSHRFLENEFSQLRQMARIFSMIFLGVAAFLLNVVLSRLISTQRQEIAALKSFGYSNAQVGWHYLQFVGVIVAAGVAAGIAAGVWLGQGLSQLYIEYYRFPLFRYELRADVVLFAALISAVAAVLATWTAVRRAVRLPSAEAMRPEPPAKYRRSLVERIGLGHTLSQSLRMILRNVERHPIKSAVSVTGIALACGVMVVGTFFSDAVDYMIEVEFERAQRQDIILRFFEPTSRRVLHDIEALEGVRYAEVYRMVPVRLRHGHRSYRTTIKGSERDRDLNRLLSTSQRVLELPLTGVLLTDFLADVLGVEPGDTIIAEVLEGRQPELRLRVAGVASQYVGVGAYMELGALNRVMQEDDAVSGAYLKIDPARRQDIYDAIKEMPRVASSDATENLIRAFYETSGEMILVFVGFISALAGVITFGVVYNSARIALAERARELASMRVLGFTRGEISFILLGELTLLTLVAIPAGLVMGRLLCWVMIQNVQQDIFRVPLIVEPGTYALAATVVIGASLLSSLVVRSRLDHLDLIAVLKTQE